MGWASRPAQFGAVPARTRRRSDSAPVSGRAPVIAARTAPERRGALPRSRRPHPYCGRIRCKSSPHASSTAPCPARRAAASTSAKRRRWVDTSPVAEMLSAASSSSALSQPGSGNRASSHSKYLLKGRGRRSRAKSSSNRNRMLSAVPAHGAHPRREFGDPFHVRSAGALRLTLRTAPGPRREPGAPLGPGCRSRAWSGCG